jgi:hypothetical protein
MKSRRFVPIGLVALFLALTQVASADYDQVRVTLSLGSPDVQSLDYRGWIYAGYNIAPLPSTPLYTAYAAGWLGFWLSPCPWPPDYWGQCQFSQVGYLADRDGLRWFVYAEPGVQCLAGSNYWYHNGVLIGCLSNVNDRVRIGTFQIFEMVRYMQDNFWVVRVYDPNGSPLDVAKIWSTSAAIFKAEMTSEEGIATGVNDPNIMLRYYHYHPQYMKWGTGFLDWPDSGGGQNNILDTISSPAHAFCPQQYGAVQRIANDPKSWFAGTGGPDCYNPQMW